MSSKYIMYFWNGMQKTETECDYCIFFWIQIEFFSSKKLDSVQHHIFVYSVVGNTIIGWLDIMNFPLNGENCAWKLTVCKTPPLYSRNRLAQWQTFSHIRICHEYYHTHQHAHTHTHPHTACTERADMALAVLFPRDAVEMKECSDWSPFLWSSAAFDTSSHQLQKHSLTRGQAQNCPPSQPHIYSLLSPLPSPSSLLGVWFMSLIDLPW